MFLRYIFHVFPRLYGIFFTFFRVFSVYFSHFSATGDFGQKKNSSGRDAAVFFRTLDGRRWRKRGEKTPDADRFNAKRIVCVQLSDEKREKKFNSTDTVILAQGKALGVGKK